MRDNSAVSWSEYESHRQQVEYAVRQKISKELLEHGRFCEDNGMPEMYINGIERARMLVLTGVSLRHEQESAWSQERLL